MSTGTANVQVVKALVLALALLTLGAARASAIEKLPLPAERFEVAGHTAFVMKAPNAGGEKPWVWYAPTLKNLPSDGHLWYFRQWLDRGLSVAGVDLGEVRGSPASAEQFTAYYQEMVRRGFSARPVLLGQSRGGLMMLAWAMRHPDKLTAFAGIYPVCNLASWPLKNSKALVLKDYGLPEAELVATLGRYNPIDNLKGLLAKQVPLFIVHGNADTLVPYDENGKLLKERYEAGGGAITVKLIEGEGHKVSPSFFECQELLDFVLAVSTKKK